MKNFENLNRKIELLKQKVDSYIVDEIVTGAPNINQKGNKMKSIAFIFFFNIMLFACTKDNFTYNSSGLVGEWSWISTCMFGGTNCQSPASTHTSHNLIFTSDSLFYAYQNDTLKISSIFHTYESGSADGVIKYDYSSGNADRFSLTHDTLSLINVYGFITWVNRYKSIKH